MISADPGTPARSGEASLAGLPSFRGEVVHGHKRGRLLGFPTANISVERDDDVPADGVYACWVRIDGETRLRGATTSIGKNPTFDDVTERRIEAYVHDLAEDIYRFSVTIWIVSHLRPMERFGSLEELVSQTSADVTRSRELLMALRAR